MPKPKLFQQRIQPAVGAFERREILVDEGLGRAGKPAPHAGLGEPEEQLVALFGVQRTLVLVHVANHHRHAEAAEEHLVMIEPEPAGDQVQRRIDVFVGALQPVLDIERALVVQIAELGFAGENGVHRTQQPIEVELIPGAGPFLQLGLHGVAGFRPFGADFRERQVALRQLGAAAVHAVEDVDHDVEGFVLTGHLLDMQIDLRHTEQSAEAADIGADIRRMRGVRGKLGDQPAEARVPGLHQAGDIDPQRIILHLYRLIEGERLRPQMKSQAA